jgi:hypothetical protein
MGLFEDIPLRSNADNEYVEASWWNIYRQRLIQAFPNFAPGGGGLIQGGFDLKTVSIDTTLTENDSILHVDVTTSGRTITLPPADVTSGKYYTIKKIDSSTNQVVIRTTDSGSEEIDRELFSGHYFLYRQGNAVTLYSDGVKYWIVNSVIGSERIVQDNTFTNWGVTAGEWGDFTALEIPPGVYVFDGVVGLFNNGALSGPTTPTIGLGTVEGNDSTGIVTNSTSDRRRNPGDDGWSGSLRFRSHEVTVASATVYRLKGNAGVVTNLQRTYFLRATRVY